MIDRSIYEYLKNNSELSGYVQGRVYLIQAPTQGLPTLPWIVIQNNGGTRNKISQNKMEEVTSLRIEVDVGANQVVMGRTIIEKAKTLLENYRGMLYTSNDVSIECSGVSGTTGIGGVYRYFFSCKVRSTDDYTAPNMYIN